MKEHHQPRQLFLDTLCDFWKMLGDRDFWGSSRKQEIAIEALTQDYLRTEHGENLETDALAFETAMSEYHRRYVYVGANF